MSEKMSRSLTHVKKKPRKKSDEIALQRLNFFQVGNGKKPDVMMSHIEAIKKDGKWFAIRSMAISHELPTEIGEKFESMDYKPNVTDLICVINENKSDSLHECFLDYQKKGNLDVRDQSGNTAIFYAANNPAKLKMLIECGADINSQNNAGNTPLFMAAQSGTLRSVEMLIKAGADIAHINHNGEGVMAFAGKCRISRMTEWVSELLRNHIAQNADIKMNEVVKLPKQRTKAL